MTTKEQERKALAQIRKIVEGLGEGSYVGTAFTGCFEDAEENIENDFGCSMYDRWQMAEQELNDVRGQLILVEETAERRNIAAAKEIADLQKQIIDLHRRLLSEEHRGTLIDILKDVEAEAADNCGIAAKAIVDLADDPTSPDFHIAVGKHRDARKRIDVYDALIARLQEA